MQAIHYRSIQNWVVWSQKEWNKHISRMAEDRCEKSKKIHSQEEGDLGQPRKGWRQQKILSHLINVSVLNLN